jgi:hypothetical protein
MSAALLLVATAAHADAPPDLPRLFPYERVVEVPAAGVVRLPLPAEVLAKTRSDLSDVRLFDAAGREIPFLIDTGEPRGATRAEQRRVAATVVDARRERVDRTDAPPLYRETYVLGLPPADAPAWELVFDAEAAEFLRRLIVETVDADGNRHQLLPDEAVFRLNTPLSAKLRVALPLRGVTPPPVQLAVTLEGEEGGFLAPQLRFEATRDLASNPSVEVELDPISFESHDGRSIVEVVRPDGLVPDALRVETKTSTFSRDVAVWDERPGEPAVSLGRATLSRLRGTTADTARELALRAAHGDRLRIELTDGDSPPLINPRIIALVRQPVLVFGAEAAGSATLRYGGGRAHTPDYDLAALRAQPGAPLDPARAAMIDAAAPQAGLGPQRDNPAYDRTPALIYALRPGAPLDVRAWAQRRRIAVPASPDGLTRLRLAPPDLAAARADLADIRVVDGQGQQWPYLLQRDAAHVWQELGVAPPVRTGRTATVALRLPVAPMTIDELVLDGDASFVDRPFRLRGRSAEGAEIAVAEGRLTLRSERPQPLTIGFAPRRLTELRLEIDDGDEAPLIWRAARARTLTADLFVVAPPGVYSLLLGAADAEAPRYDIDRARAVVFAVRGGIAAAGPLEANPEHTLGVSAASGFAAWGSRLLLWAVLLIAVLVLGAVTLRTVRR